MTPTKSPNNRPESNGEKRGDGNDIESHFPSPEYREYQREILLEAKKALYDTPGVDTVVIDAPTGVGKSGVNIALANYASYGAFYTTPQKKLRDQLSHDKALSKHHSILRSRRDYTCESTPTQYAQQGKTYNCQNCPVNSRDDISCQQIRCNYWVAKERAMDDPVATLTFAMVIVDGRIPSHQVTVNGEPVSKDAPVTVGDGDVIESTQFSFSKREVLVIDEAHTLAEQVTSLHADISLAPWTIKTKPVSSYTNSDRQTRGASERQTDDPYNVFVDLISQYDRNTPQTLNNTLVSDLTDVLLVTKEAIDTFRSRLSNHQLNEKGGNKKSQLDSISWKLENVIEDVKSGFPWVITTNKTSIGDDDFQINLKPVWADTFLKQNVWTRADKVILSTATLPYRNNPEKWLQQIGRDPKKTHFISKPMPFPPENRPVRLDYQIGNMSGDGVDKYWKVILDQIKELARKHEGEKGLIHTASYARAKRVHEALPHLTMQHQRSDDNAKDVINRWQESNKQILLTPSMTEGVDLEGDLCRWQILLKVPLRNLSDPRVEYLVREQNDWEWYNDVAAREVIQSIGRAVRSPDDYATYYVFDSKFNDVMDGRTPQWLADAFVRS